MHSRLESSGDFQSLHDATTRQHFNDGLFVSAEAFHGFTESCSIFIWIEWISWKYSWLALECVDKM